MSFRAVLVAFFYTVFLLKVTAITHYVDVNTTNAVSPFTSWASAASNIQDAVDAAGPGDDVLVNDGVFETGGRVQYGSLTNRVVVDKPIAVRSVNGSATTVIRGGGTVGDNAVRCAYLTNGASLAGFSLLNGATRILGDLYTEDCGGGLWCESKNAIVSNCLLISNTANMYAGGCFSGTLSNCSIIGNTANAAAGGAMSNVLNGCLIMSNLAIQVGMATSGGGVQGCTLNDCALIGNAVRNGHWGTSAFGGGAALSNLKNCVVSNNLAEGDGGGVWVGTLEDCSVFNNAAGNLGGGVWTCSAVNCVIVSNTSTAGGGFGGSSATNCTIVGNSAVFSGGGAFTGYLYNCIVYYNAAPDGDFNDVGEPNWTFPYCTLNYCCAPTIASLGTGNITNPPVLANPAAADFRLQSNSPCINAGNHFYVGSAVDLDGNPRVQGRSVDLGAYEFQKPSSILSYAWAQQFGFPTDGSADTADSDGDGMNNYQEWVAGTNPRDAASALKLSVSQNQTGVSLTWQSLSNRIYYVQRANAANMASSAWTTKFAVGGQSGMAGYFEYLRQNPGPWFYRLEVVPPF